MLREERHKIILNQVNLHHKVITTDLRKLLKVSLDTVRRDLTELEKKGSLEKVHGGAVSKSFHVPFQQPRIYAREAKITIAKKALSLIRDGMVIVCGGGTIMLELAKLLPKELKGTIFTVSPLVALEITQRSSVNVMLVGGSLSRDSYICTGATVISQLAEIQADLCLIGTNGLSIQQGITDFDWEVAQVKKALIKSSGKIAVLCLAEKIDINQKMQVCRLNVVDCLFTELSPADKKLSKFSKRLELR